MQGTESPRPLPMMMMFAGQHFQAQCQQHAREVNEYANSTQLTTFLPHNTIATPDILRFVAETSNDAAKTSFPWMLHKLIDETDDSIVSWTNGGTAFKIHDRDKFIDRASSCFRLKKFRSFTRQLNMWNFGHDTTGPNKGAYWHPMFVQGKRYQCQDIQRTKQKARQSGANNAGCQNLPNNQARPKPSHHEAVDSDQHRKLAYFHHVLMTQHQSNGTSNDANEDHGDKTEARVNSVDCAKESKPFVPLGAAATPYAYLSTSTGASSGGKHDESIRLKQVEEDETTLRTSMAQEQPPFVSSAAAAVPSSQLAKHDETEEEFSFRTKSGRNPLHDFVEEKKETTPAWALENECTQFLNEEPSFQDAEESAELRNKAESGSHSLDPVREDEFPDYDFDSAAQHAMSKTPETMMASLEYSSLSSSSCEDYDDGVMLTELLQQLDSEPLLHEMAERERDHAMDTDGQ